MASYLKYAKFPLENYLLFNFIYKLYYKPQDSVHILRYQASKLSIEQNQPAFYENLPKDDTRALLLTD